MTARNPFHLNVITKLFYGVIIPGLAVWLVWHHPAMHSISPLKAAQVSADSLPMIDLPAREQTTRSFPITANTQVEVSDINGLVQVEAADDNRATILIVRSALDNRDLIQNHVQIKSDLNRLAIQGEQSGKDSAASPVRQRLVLRLPRQIQCTVHNIHGAVLVMGAKSNLHLQDVIGSVRLEAPAPAKTRCLPASAVAM